MATFKQLLSEAADIRLDPISLDREAETFRRQLIGTLNQLHPTYKADVVRSSIMKPTWACRVVFVRQLKMSRYQNSEFHYSISFEVDFDQKKISEGQTTLLLRPSSGGVAYPFHPSSQLSWLSKIKGQSFSTSADLIEGIRKQVQEKRDQFFSFDLQDPESNSEKEAWAKIVYEVIWNNRKHLDRILPWAFKNVSYLIWKKLLSNVQNNHEFRELLRLQVEKYPILNSDLEGLITSFVRDQRVEKDKPKSAEELRSELDKIMTAQAPE